MRGTILACVLFLSWVCLFAATVDELAKQNNLFSNKLFVRIATKEANFVCSPLSVAVVLSMLLYGAQGQTASGIRTALGYNNSTDINKCYADLIPKWLSINNYQLSLSNSLWIQEGFPIEVNYSKAMVRIFRSQPNTFQDSNSGVQKINSWVSSQTNNKIPKFLDSLVPSTVMVLVNALYFKGNWTYPFKENATKSGLFNNGSSTVMVQFMEQQRRLPYGQSDKLQSSILYLPYKGGDTVLVIILPNNESTDLNTIITHIDFQTEVFKDFPTYMINVKIPKFKIESNIDLNQPLKNLGMDKAFTESAEFAGISRRVGVKVSNVFQKAIIDVNEKGSEAAADTALPKVKTLSVQLPRAIIQFYANHPFIFSIYHKLTKSILFLGTYYGV